MKMLDNEKEQNQFIAILSGNIYMYYIVSLYISNIFLPTKEKEKYTWLVKKI